MLLRLIIDYYDDLFGMSEKKNSIGLLLSLAPI